MHRQATITITTAYSYSKVQFSSSIPYQEPRTAWVVLRGSSSSSPFLRVSSTGHGEYSLRTYCLVVYLIPTMLRPTSTSRHPHLTSTSHHHPLQALRLVINNVAVLVLHTGYAPYSLCTVKNTGSHTLPGISVLASSSSSAYNR
jgi:hypothetical protein